MKKKKTGIPLNEVFARAEKNPKWKSAYAEADIEVRLALEIAKARARARLTQSQLAKAIGTTQSVVSRIEKGEQNLTLVTLGRIAAALHSNLIIHLQHR